MYFGSIIVKYKYILFFWCFSYSIDPGDLDIPIGCVVRSLPGSFSRDQLDVEPLSQLDDVLTLEDNEELVSHIITLIPTSGEKELMVCKEK